MTETIDRPYCNEIVYEDILFNYQIRYLCKVSLFRVTLFQDEGDEFQNGKCRDLNLFHLLSKMVDFNDKFSH